MSSEPQDKLRRKFTPDQKFKIIKEQMTTRTSVSDICKKYDISTGNFYKWQEKFLAGALNNFKKSDDGPKARSINRKKQFPPPAVLAWRACLLR